MYQRLFILFFFFVSFSAVVVVDSLFPTSSTLVCCSVTVVAIACATCIYFSLLESRQGSQICLWIEYVTTKYIIMLICARYPNKINRLGIDSRALSAYLMLLLLLLLCTSFFFFFINLCTRTYTIIAHSSLSIPFLANIKFHNFTMRNRERAHIKHIIYINRCASQPFSQSEPA